jgi:hypothetical protein
VNKDTEPKLTWDRIRKKMKTQFFALTEMKFKNPAMPNEKMDAEMQQLYNSVRSGFKEL